MTLRSWGLPIDAELLWAPATYVSAPTAARARTCNGCGAKGLGGWLVPDTLWGLAIEECCDVHDWMYSEGGDESDRLWADMVFLGNMLYLIERQSGAIASLLRMPRRHRALKYFEAVRAGGAPWFQHLP